MAVLPRLFSWAGDLVAEGRASRFCVDTYERELERYGGPEGAATAEAILVADSRAVVDLLRLHHRGVVTLDLTTLAVVSVDDLLVGLWAGAPPRSEWLRDHGATKASGEEYRRRKGVLRHLLGDAEYLRDQPGGDAVARVLAARRQALGELSGRLDTLAKQGRLWQPKDTLMRSFVHLHCNRLLGGDAASEALVLGLLDRTRYGLEQSRPR